MIRLRHLPIVAIFVLAATIASAAPQRPTVVVLPFDNFSGEESANGEVAKLVTRAVESRGWTVADGETVQKLLETARVRYLDSVDEAIRLQILEQTGASAIITGAIYTYGGQRNPTVALSARMIFGDGSVSWGNICGLSSDDTEKALGFGRKTTTAAVARETVGQLMREFPEPGDRSEPLRGPSKPLFKAGARSYRATDGEAIPRRICVLPFENSSSSSEAPRVVDDILTVRLAAAGFEIVEAADLRAAALQARIGSFRTISTEDLARLVPSVGTPLFLRGTIFDYSDSTGGHLGIPQLDLELTLVDTRSGRVVWTAQHDRSGTDYVGFLMLGQVSSVVALADRVVSDIVARGPAVHEGATTSAPSRAAQKKVAKRHGELRAANKHGEN